MHKAMGRIAAAVLVAVPLGLAAAPAGAQPYPPGACELALSLSVTTPGETVVASTVECDSPYVPGTQVTLTLNSDPVFLKTIAADANGHFSTPVTIPANATLGAHTVQSSGLGVSGSSLVLDAPITLVGGGAAAGAARAGGGGGLAFTGGWIMALVAAALVCLTTGTAFVVGSRRRAEVRRQFS